MTTTFVMLIMLLTFPDIGALPFQIGPFDTVETCEDTAKGVVAEMQKQRPDVGIGWGCELKKATPAGQDT